MRALLFPGHDTDFDVSKAIFLEKLVQLDFTEAEPMVRIQLARLFEPMAQYSENHQAPASSQYPMRCADRALGMNGVMQRLAEDREIDAVFCNRRIFNVAKPVFKILKSMFLRQL